MQMPGLIWFEWEKCPDGYTVETLRAEYLELDSENPNEPKAYPTDRAPAWVYEMLRERDFVFWARDEVGHQYLIPKSDSVLKFHPLEGNSGAFMEFADCCDSTSEILRFVAKYGLLEKGIAGYRLWFEALKLDAINNSTKNMRHAIQDWERAKQENDFEDLIPLFNWAEDEYGEVHGDDGLSNASANIRLRHRSDRSGPPLLSVVPESLNSALWLQFGQAVSANTQLQRCATCPTWFSYGTGTGRRKSAHYCSDRCRKAAFRNAQAAKKASRRTER